MHIKRLIEEYNKLNEQEIKLTAQQVRNIINQITFENVELEEDEKLKVVEISTLYNTYKAYGLDYDNKLVMLMGDYLSYIQEVCDEFETALPDGFEQCFDNQKLKQLGQNDNYYIIQSLKFLNKVEDKDYYGYERLDAGEVDGIEYQLLEEIVL